MAERLRVGILCDGLVFRHWQAECIRQVLAVDGVEPVVLVVCDKAGGEQRKPTMKHAMYRWFKNNRLRAEALVPDDLTDVLKGIPALACRPVGPSNAQGFEPDDLAAIRQYAPDVLLRFGFNILLGEILTLPKHGIWSYHHGDEEHYRGRPVGFWEIVRGEPVTGVTLQRLTEKLDAGLVLRKGWFRTVDHSLSENLDNVMLGSTGWMAQLCHELITGREDAAQGVPSGSDAPVGEVPGNMDLLGFLFTCNTNRIAHNQRRVAQRDEWNIGVLYQPIASLLESKPSLNVRWLPSPGPGQQRRTPFGYMADGQLNVLYGKYNAVVGKGDISRLRPKRDNVLKRSRTMLSTGHVLSHPYLLEQEGQLMVIPESSAGRVDLYRVNTANEALDFVRTLLDQPLCAPQVFQHEGRWWLFGTKAPWEDVALYVYHAPTLEGPWTPHALNPVKMDVRTARPAGTPFVHQGQLHRPARDNSLTQGWRVALMRIVELSPTAFREELVRTIGPLKGSAWSHGMGTLSAVGDLTLVDGKRPISSRGKDLSERSSGSRRRTKPKVSERERDRDDDEDD